MQSSIARLGGLVAGIATLAPVAGAQTVPDLDLVPLARFDIDSFGRVADPIPFAEPVDASGGSGGSVLCWSNGDRDNVTAQLAQIDTVNAQTFRVADDFTVKAGLYNFVDQITVCFAVSDSFDGLMNKPRFELHLYDDCSGRPGNLVYSVLNTEIDKYAATLVGPSPWPGFNLWSVTFDVQQFLAGYGRWWIAPVGHANLMDGFFFWVSSNNGVIQGVQGQLADGPGPTAPDDWYDASECACPDTCTDFYFLFTCHRCCLDKNNVPHDPTGGAASLQLKGATIDTARAADNFQIPGEPGGEVEICRVEAWFATNCPLEKVFLEVYANDCNMPGAKLCTIDLEGFPLAATTGQSFGGVPVYHLVWPQVTGATLLTGRDYWLSVVARGTGSILDKATWMYLQQGACNINITEGKLKNPFVAGLEGFTFVSEATMGPPRDFAFKLFTNDVGARTAPQGSDAEGGAPVSIDAEVSRAATQLLR